MDKNITWSDSSFISRCSDFLFFFVALSLIIYAVVFSWRPFSNSLLYQVVYWALIVMLFIAWFFMLDQILKNRQFEVKQGIIEESVRRFLIFRSHKYYVTDIINGIEIKNRKKQFLLQKKYDVVLLLKSGTKIVLKEFYTNDDAVNFCYQINELLNKNN